MKKKIKEKIAGKERQLQFSLWRNEAELTRSAQGPGCGVDI